MAEAASTLSDVVLDSAGMRFWRHPYPRNREALPDPVHPADVGRLWEALQRAADPAGDGRYHAEYRVRSAEGWRWTSAWGLVEFEDGPPARRPVGVSGVSLDITDRKRNELLLAAQKQSLEMMVSGAGLATVLTHLTSVVEQQSNGESVACILLLDDGGRLHHGASTSLPANYLAAIEGLQASPDLGTCSVAAITGQVVVTPSFEDDPKWAALKHWPLSLGLKGAWSRPIIARDGRVLGTFGTYFRETREPTGFERQAVEILSHTAALAIERAQDERALRESERRLETLVTNLPGMAYRCPTAEPWPLTYASEGALELTGYPAADFMAQRLNWQGVVHPDDLERVGIEVGDALGAGRPFEVIYRIQHRDGSPRWVLDRGRGIVDPETRELIAIEGFAGDLTRQHDAEEALREADRRKDEFIATLSHELRNPLAPLRTALHLLRLNDDGQGAVARLLGTMERQVDHLVRLVDDLLEVARISRGTFELRRTRLDVSTIVKMAIETTEPLIAASGHQLRVVGGERDVWVDGDAVRLSQILANLLNNAAKYMERGGEIVLETRVEGESLVMEVRDHGEGIDPEALPRLFQMFVRADHTRGRHRGGLGIGLALSRTLAQMHGGTLTASSAGRGRGSTFTLLLPLAPAATDATAAAAPVVADAPPMRVRVLVCDDNADAADLTAQLLSGHGCDVQLAYDGAAALREAERLRPDVILLDIGMPDRDGYDVCRHIRQAEWGAGVTVVAVTGWGQLRDHHDSATAGFDHHLVKPVQPDVLVNLLQDVSRRRVSPRPRSSSPAGPGRSSS